MAGIRIKAGFVVLNGVEFDDRAWSETSKRLIPVKPFFTRFRRRDFYVIPTIRSQGKVEWR